MKTRLISTAFLLLSSLSCLAEDSIARPRFDFDLQYDAELHTDFHGGCNFLGLLRLNGCARLGQHLMVNLSTISTTQARESLTGDALTMSSLDAGLDIPLTLAVAGVTWESTASSGTHSLFAGIRNTGEDYFTAETAAFFTNSSCGLFPTLSANFPLCTYPFAAMGLHYAYSGAQWGVKASLYNGGEHYRFTGRESMFRLCPQSDGLLLMMQGEYKRKGYHLFLGGSLYEASPTLWTYAQWRVGSQQTRHLDFLAAYSYCLDSAKPCRQFLGAGAIVSAGDTALGLFASYTDLHTGHELATELSCDIALSPRVSLKPAVHYIRSNTQTVVLGLARMTLTL